jgi:hypothetical protein
LRPASHRICNNQIQEDFKGKKNMTKTRGPLSALFVAFLTTFSMTASSDISETVRDRLRSANLSVDTDLIDTNLADFAKANFNIGIGMRQNRDKRTYSRSEKFILGSRIGRSLGSDIFFNSFVDGRSELEFIRQFDSQRDALNVVSTPPYNPLHKVPTSAEKADSLAVGDYVKFKSKLTFSVGPSTAHSFGITRVSGAINYILYGDFQMELYKRADGEYFLRASTLKKGTKSLSLSYQPTSALRVFAVRPGLAGQVGELVHKQLIPTTFASASLHESLGNLLTIEYVYRFRHPEDPGAKAFEDVVNPENWVTDTFRMANPLHGDPELPQAIAVRFEESERLADLASSDEFDVLRNSRSDTRFKENGGSIRLDLKLIEGGWTTNFVQQDFTVQDSSGFWKQYKIVNLAKTSQLGFISLLGAETRREGNLVFEMTPQGRIANFMKLSFHYSRDEKTMTRAELAAVQGQIHRMMPERFHAQLSLSDWSTQFLRRETRIDAELIFHEPGWELVNRLTMDDINGLLDNYFALVSAGHEQRPKFYGDVRVRNGSQSDNNTWLENARFDLKYIKRCVPATFAINSGLREGYDPKDQFRCSNFEFDPNGSISGLFQRRRDRGPVRFATNEERWQYFVALRKNVVFFQLASGILSRMLDLAIEKYGPEGAKFEDYAAFRLLGTTQDGEAIDVTIGDFDQADGMRNILRARDRILNRAFDPEIFRELN